MVDPSYDIIPAPFNDVMFLTVMNLVGFVATTFGIWFFRSRCSSPLFPWMKKVIF